MNNTPIAILTMFPLNGERETDQLRRMSNQFFKGVKKGECDLSMWNHRLELGGGEVFVYVCSVC